MIELDNVILSDDVKDSFFVCDLEKCKGACCVEGDLGAPLEEDELEILDEILPTVMPYLSPEAQAVINEQGGYLLDEEGDFSTTTIDNKECVYAIYDTAGILKCGIEQAYNDGKINYKKPISCHLYPIRVKKYDGFHAVNYDRWSICAPACTLGQALKVPVYQFLKEPLIRKFGEGWYNQLCALVQNKES